MVGRSNLFGKPMAQLLLAANATVTVCHSRTRELPRSAPRADVLIAAVGGRGWSAPTGSSPGAVVIDVGINRARGRPGRRRGLRAVAAVAGAITPVPGGVGPMTIACLLRNTLIAARSGGRL